MDLPVRQRRSYFWRIPVEAVINVVRHLGSRPRNANWSEWLNPSYLNALLRASDSIAAAFGRALKCTRDRRTIRIDRDSAEQYWQLLRVIGPVFTGLTVLDVKWPERMRDICIHKCAVNLRCLRLHTDSLNGLSPILRACRSKLEKLELEGGVLGKEHVGAIAKHCHGLKSLTLNHTKIEKRLQNVWLTVGPTLTSLSLNSLEIWNVCDKEFEDLSPEIAWYCIKLTSLEFQKFTSCTRTSVERLCNGLGNQMQVLSLPTPFVQDPRGPAFAVPLGPNSLSSILASCPNVVIDTWVNAWSSEELPVLKDRARKLYIQLMEDDFWDVMGPESSDVDLMENCNLDLLLQGSREVICVEQLEFEIDDGAGACLFFSTFFSAPKTCLRELILDFACHLHNPDFGEMYHALANHVHTLEVLEYREVPMVHSGILRLAEANPDLRSLKIDFGLAFVFISEDDGYDIIDEDDERADIVAQERARHEHAAVETTDLFSRCLLLKKVVIWSTFLKLRSQRIADACFMLRNREVDVFVTDIQYAL